MFHSTRLTLAAAALALAAVPAFAQTTKDMGKDSSMGTTSSDAKAGSMMKKDDAAMKKDAMKKDGMAPSAGTGTRGEDNSGKTTSGMTQGK